jgi:tRNA(Ile)-lysidine synthase
MECALLNGLPAALRRRVIGRWLRLEHGLADLSAGHLHAVEALVTDWHGQLGVDLPGGVRVRRVTGWLELGPVPH